MPAKWRSATPPRDVEIGDELFRIEDWRVEHPLHAGREVVKGINLHVRKGEVVGIAGLMGAGRTELAMSVFGRAYGRNIRGKAQLAGKTLDLSTIEKAIQAGLAYVTEDRKTLGLILTEDIKRNITLANLGGVSKDGVIDNGREASVAQQYRTALRIRTPSINQRAMTFLAAISKKSCSANGCSPGRRC